MSVIYLYLNKNNLELRATIQRYSIDSNCMSVLYLHFNKNNLELNIQGHLYSIIHIYKYTNNLQYPVTILNTLNKKSHEIYRYMGTRKVKEKYVFY